jgi:hypothetical protein
MADLEPGGREGIGGAVQVKAAEDTEGGGVGEESKEGGSVRDTIIVMLLVALLGIHAWGMMREDRLRDQVASLKAQQMAVQAQQEIVKARQVGICAIQGWQAAMYDQYLEMGRGRQ